MARGLNFFSGLEYTPAPLSFLLRERQWRMGEIEKLRERIDADRSSIGRKCDRLVERSGSWLGVTQSRIAEKDAGIAAAEARIAELQDDITALDRVIPMHPVKVDLSILPPIRKRLPDLIPRGHLERGVLDVLRSVAGHHLATAEIAVALALEHGLDTTQGRTGWKRVRQACVKCLNHLEKQGKVIRLHAKQTYGDGYWIISER